MMWPTLICAAQVSPVGVHGHLAAYAAPWSKFDLDAYTLGLVHKHEVLVHDVYAAFVTYYGVAILQQIFFKTLELNGEILPVKPNSDITKVGLIMHTQKSKFWHGDTLLVALGSIGKAAQHSSIYGVPKFFI